MDAFSGAIIQGTLLTNGSITKSAARGAFIAPLVLYIIIGFFYFCLGCIKQCYFDYNGAKVKWPWVYIIVKCVVDFTVFVGGIAYFFGDNFQILLLGFYDQEKTERLQEIGPIILVVAVILYRIIPFMKTKLADASENEHVSHSEQVSEKKIVQGSDNDTKSNSEEQDKGNDKRENQGKEHKEQTECHDVPLMIVNSILLTTIIVEYDSWFTIASDGVNKALKSNTTNIINRECSQFKGLSEAFLWILYAISLITYLFFCEYQIIIWKNKKQAQKASVTQAPESSCTCTISCTMSYILCCGIGVFHAVLLALFLLADNELPIRCAGHFPNVNKRHLVIFKFIVCLVCFIVWLLFLPLVIIFSIRKKETDSEKDAVKEAKQTAEKEETTRSLTHSESAI